MAKLLSTIEAAKRLGLTYQRINQLIQDGVLPAQKIGRDYVIEEADLSKITERPETRGRKKNSKPSNLTDKSK